MTKKKLQYVRKDSKQESLNSAVFLFLFSVN